MSDMSCLHPTVSKILYSFSGKEKKIIDKVVTKSQVATLSHLYGHGGPSTNVKNAKKCQKM